MRQVLCVEAIWRRILAALLWVALLISVGGLKDVFLACQANPVTISGSVVNITGINTPNQPGSPLNRSILDNNILPILISMIIGFALIVAGIAYSIGYNRRGGEKVVVKRDGRLG